MWKWWLVVIVVVRVEVVMGLGSMSSIAVSYGDRGPVVCSINTDGTHVASCYGGNSAITESTPVGLPFSGLTGGDGFVCGVVRGSEKGVCWGASAYIRMGLPLSPYRYTDIAAGDYHVCALRRPSTGRLRGVSAVDCWGYNMTRSLSLPSQIRSLSAASDFTCALFALNRTALCWGGGGGATPPPPSLPFHAICAGGYHVCGLLAGPDSRAVCWGRSLQAPPPSDPLLSLAAGKFHACGIRASDRSIVCWGYVVEPATPLPRGLTAYDIAAGDYFTCAILARSSLLPLCWGSSFPTSLPVPVPVPGGHCRTAPCFPGSYHSPSPASQCRLCVPCSLECPPNTFLKAHCSPDSDRLCAYNCSACASPDCHSACSAPATASEFWSMQVPVIVAEIAFAVLLVAAVSVAAVLYVRCRLRDCRCTPRKAPSARGASFQRVRRARLFAYDELHRATNAFSHDSLVGKGSFSDVFRGVLDDGTVVAVKRALKRWKEFQTELDLLSRLNHAHLLNLLGYCEEGEQRLLVYEYMAHGSLHQHLHGDKAALEWVRRATIAVQAARGIEYLHGYACPPVIHRDIKSSNILIDEDDNARVADFGLSLLGPADSCSPLPELPAGTLGYLDPEYYRLHYLTTKSDVYSFGVLLLEILSGRKAIHMERGSAVNLVEWAVPLIKAGDSGAVLDPKADPPKAEAESEALRRVANVACKCVRMRGKERPSMDKVTTALERALALLIEQPVLPTELVLGSTRLHLHNNKPSSDRITFPSLPSSMRRKSSVSDPADNTNTIDNDNNNNNAAQNKQDKQDTQEEEEEEEEEICPAASPRHHLFLHHNF